MAVSGYKIRHALYISGILGDQVLLLEAMQPSDFAHVLPHAHLMPAKVQKNLLSQDWEALINSPI
jgi:hypothetical protein